MNTHAYLERNKKEVATLVNYYLKGFSVPKEDKDDILSDVHFRLLKSNIDLDSDRAFKYVLTVVRSAHSDYYKRKRSDVELIQATAEAPDDFSFVEELMTIQQLGEYLTPAERKYIEHCLDGNEDVVYHRTRRYKLKESIRRKLCRLSRKS